MKTKLNLLAAGMVLAAVNAGFGQSTVRFTASTCTVPEWAGTATLTVQRTTDINTAVSVDYATADGTATNGWKYCAANGTLVFEPGVTNQSIVVPILNNGVVEGTKTFTVTLSNPTNAVLGTPANATVNILDVDLGMQFQFINYNAANGWSLPEDVGTVLLGIVRGDDASQEVTVDLATSDGTAANGVDYVGFTTNLSFAPTERLKFVPVPILNDGLKETATKTFTATLSNPVGVTLGATKTTLITIMDNDQGFQFEMASCSVAEDAGVALIGVVRVTDDTNAAVSVDVATTDGSALNGLDYTGLTNTLTFAPGERRKVLPMAILNDGIKESLENFRLTLSNPGGGAVLGAPTTVTVYIGDNDPGLGFEQTLCTNAWGQAADFSVIVLRGSDGQLGPISVDYATGGGTATAGMDYQGTTGTLTFAEGETVKCLNIPILRPRAVGTPKTFQVTLSNPTPGVTLGTATTTVKIIGTYVTVAPAFDTALTIRREWGANVLTWAGGGPLQRADKLTGPWQTLTSAFNPCTVQSSVTTAFYRVIRPRVVNLYIPSSYDGQTNLPLVLLLHGYSANGDWQETTYMRFQPLAEARGFLYCYPTGTLDRGGKRFWNATDAGCDFWSTGVDDAGYFRGLIAEIERCFSVDRKRVHLIGHSNGGRMAYRMACESAELIAGIASLAGMPFLDTGNCAPAEPVNILHIHGTADDIDPYFGGALTTGNPSFQFPANMPPSPGAQKAVQLWADYNEASGQVTDPAPSMDLDLAVPGLDAVATRYVSSPPGGAVELWTINGGGHIPTFYSGTAASEFAPRVIDWLLAHPKP